jgi:hypothetical protein
MKAEIHRSQNDSILLFSADFFTLLTNLSLVTLLLKLLKLILISNSICSLILIIFQDRSSSVIFHLVIYVLLFQFSFFLYKICNGQAQRKANSILVMRKSMGDETFQLR